MLDSHWGSLAKFSPCKILSELLKFLKPGILLGELYEVKLLGILQRWNFPSAELTSCLHSAQGKSHIRTWLVEEGKAGLVGEGRAVPSSQWVLKGEMRNLQPEFPVIPAGQISAEARHQTFQGLASLV